MTESIKSDAVAREPDVHHVRRSETAEVNVGVEDARGPQTASWREAGSCRSAEGSSNPYVRDMNIRRRHHVVDSIF